MRGLLAGLDGRFVAPGPSGAPTRGRPDVLPTGRNFYSVDTRTVPTPAAWTLGWKSAALLVERHAQEHGDWPKRLALTAWGTSNMRTGGDDIAQALALMGVRPTWDEASRRVTGFEILPARVLDRPRVDVTLRISGFFRDAFPNLIDLFDCGGARRRRARRAGGGQSAGRARARPTTRRCWPRRRWRGRGRATLAGCRVFGSKPGAYGAGLQALIDERGWESDADLARAYVAWGGYAYGAGLAGRGGARRVRDAGSPRVEGVVQNQDNREHDILDSDDYYQFEGGMTAAVRVLSGDAAGGLPQRPLAPRAARRSARSTEEVGARRPRPRRQSEVDRGRHAPRLQGRASRWRRRSITCSPSPPPPHCVEDHHFDAVYDAYVDGRRGARASSRRTTRRRCAR